MESPKLPNTVSIPELAEFRDKHDVTDFEVGHEEIAEKVFIRGSAIKVPLDTGEGEAVEKIAEARGNTREDLVRGWVLQHIA